MGRKNYYRTLCQRALWDLSKASLNLKGPFGVTNLKVCSQKFVPIFSFFFVWAGTSPKGAGKTEVFSGKFCFSHRPQGLPKFKRAQSRGDKPEGLLPENCPNFFFFFVWAGPKNYRTLCQRARENFFRDIKNKKNK
jgi:hypothetical protein